MHTNVGHIKELAAHSRGHLRRGPLYCYPPPRPPLPHSHHYHYCHPHGPSITELCFNPRLLIMQRFVSTEAHTYLLMHPTCPTRVHRLLSAHLVHWECQMVPQSYQLLVLESQALELALVQDSWSQTVGWCCCLMSSAVSCPQHSSAAHKNTQHLHILEITKRSRFW